MQVRGVDFVGVAVTDMEKAKQFYGEALGLAETVGYGDDWAEYETSNLTIALIRMPDDDIVGGAEGGMKNGVVALAVADIHAAVDELRAKGVKVVWDVAEYPPCYMAMIEDPFGNRMSLHKRKDGTAG